MRVVKVNVMRPGSADEVLIEARQIFPNGNERVRGRPLSEKVLPRERPLAAAARGVLEEILIPLKGDAASPSSLDARRAPLLPPLTQTVLARLRW